ncbi:MAG: hypothetical protein M3Z46_04305 [Actinomycetota bacterium]|nr:hypothetical protein [Actinomycetota bacterium]
MKKRRIALGVGIAVTVALWATMALPASARWAYGNGFSGLDVVTNGPPDSAQEPTVCANRIKGRVAGTYPAPPGPWSAETVDVFATKEDLTGSTAEAGGLRTYYGVLVPPTLSQTTARPTELSPHESYEDFSGNTYPVYAAAPFNFAPSSTAVHPGDNIAVKIRGYSAYFTTRAASCPAGTK